MNNCNLSASDLATFAEGLHTNKVLQMLSLHHNYVHSVGVKALCGALSSAQSRLRSLDLSSNQIDDEGGKELGKMLRIN